MNCTPSVDSLVQLFGGASKIYEDNASGKLSDERYATLSLSYEEEQKTLKASVPEMQTYLETETGKTEGMQRFIQKVKQITELKALPPELIHEFVDKIVVYAPRYLDGKRVQLLDIYYSGVGILHELTPEEMEEAFQQHLAQRNKEKKGCCIPQSMIGIMQQPPFSTMGRIAGFEPVHAGFTVRSVKPLHHIRHESAYSPDGRRNGFIGY